MSSKQNPERLKLHAEPVPRDLIPRDELAELAQREGLDLTVRTLRYWALKDWIPKPWRRDGEGTRAYYPKSLLRRLRVLSALRPDNIRKLREDNLAEVESLKFGEEQFSVLPSTLRWKRENTEFSIRMLEDGSGMLLIQRKTSNNGQNSGQRASDKRKAKTSSDQGRYNDRNHSGDRS